MTWISTPTVTVAVKSIAIATEAITLWRLRARRPWSFSHQCLAAIMACLVVGDIGDVVLGGWREPHEQDRPLLLAIRLSYRLAMMAICVLVAGNSIKSMNRRTWLSPQLWLGFLVAAPFDCCSIAALLNNPAAASPLLLASEFLFHLMFLFSFALSVIVLASADDPAWLTFAAGAAQGNIATLGPRATWVMGLEVPPLFYEVLWTAAILILARGTNRLAQGIKPLPSLCARSLYRTVKTLILAAMFASLIPLFSFEEVTKRTIQVACLLGNAGIAMVTLLAYAFDSLDRAFLAAVERSLQITTSVAPQLPIRSLPIEHQQALEVIVSHHIEYLRIQATREARLKAENARMKAKQEISRRVAHDIRSPLAALEVAIAQPEIGCLPNAVRDLVRLAVQRIHDIANDLVLKQAPTMLLEAHAKAIGDAHLDLIVDAAVSEKRAEISRRHALFINYTKQPSTHQLFARAGKVELSRILSNILNNAIEASGANAKVDVEVLPPTPSQPDRATIVIADRGPGIEPSIVSQLGSKKITLGKPHGQGLGLLHARQAINRWGGEMLFRARAGGGTEVVLQLHCGTAPAWFCRHLCFAAEETLVVVDDDPTIHDLWRMRLGPYLRRERLSLLHASTLPDFVRLVAQTASEGTRRQFLVDHEFFDSIDVGLEVAWAQGVARETTLVTGHYHRPSLQDRCLDLGTKLLPKALAASTPLLLRQSASCAERQPSASQARRPMAHAGACSSQAQGTVFCREGDGLA